MPRLVVEKGRQKGKSVRVDKTSAIVVGRGNTADLQLDDPMTSRRHFSVEFKKGNFYAIDLGSANGTYVNGGQVREQVLEIGDKLQAGEILLSFLAAESTIKHDTVTGQKIAGYLIEERVGRGAMGTVYKAIQLSLDRTVALKILARELVSDKNFIDMFVREAQNAGQLNHPNIVQVYDVGQHKNIYFISMEFMAGGSVYELINREGAQPFERALQIALDSVRGLRYAEKCELVHRDIKPDNLMLRQDGITKIGDLGIARRLQAGSAVLEEGIFGSPHYMAPEQAQGLKIDCRTDIYSLGATMYHVLSGKTPFTGKSPQEIILKQINEQPTRLLEANPTVPPELAGVIEKCMAKKPDERYQSSEDLLKELEGLQSRSATLRPRVTLKERAQKIRKKYLLPVIVIVIAAAVATVGFFAYRHYQHSSWHYQHGLQDATAALAAAQALYDDKKPDEALKVIAELEKEYLEFPGVIDAAGELAVQARKLKETLATETREKQATGALRAVMAFEKANADKLQEAAQKYRKVVLDYPGTGAAVAARVEERRLDRIIEERHMLELGARAQVSAVLDRSRSFRARRRFGKALEELASFPERFRPTEAGKEIEAEKTTVMQEARNAFAQVNADIERLITRKQYQDAKNLLLRTMSTYEVAELTSDGTKTIGRIDRLIEQDKLQREKAVLARDRKEYEEGRAKARKMILEHRFENAVSEYRSLQLLLRSAQYRGIAKRKLDEINLIKSAKKTLVEQINGKTLSRPIQLMVKKVLATPVSATDDKLTVKFVNRPGEADCPWESFEAKVMVPFLDACKLNARGHLAAGVYAKELGDSPAARKHFSKALALDPALRAGVTKFSRDLK